MNAGIWFGITLFSLYVIFVYPRDRERRRHYVWWRNYEAEAVKRHTEFMAVFQTRTCPHCGETFKLSDGKDTSTGDPA